MAKTIHASVNLALRGEFANSADLGTSKFPLAYNGNFVFTNGTGANQVGSVFTDTRTLAASGTEDLDLSGVLTDAFGAAIAFTKVKGLVIKAAAGNTNDLLVGGHDTAACASFFGDATDILRVKPGGMVALMAPNAAGYAVAAGTADLLTIANSGAGTGVTYDILILGTV